MMLSPVDVEYILGAVASGFGFKRGMNEEEKES